MSDAQYEITYTINRRESEDSEPVEIGFGASSFWNSPEQAAHIMMSDIQNYGWETEEGHPDPEDIKAEIEAID